jgi:hypothetical protein
VKRAAWALLLALVSVAAFAARPVKFADLCPGYTISKRGDDVLIRCPGLTEPWMTIQKCRNPRVTRHSNGDVTIACN